MNDVIKECLENAQAIRIELHKTRDHIDGVPLPVHIRLLQLERMATYLLAAVDYLARNDGERTVLYDTFEEASISGIGPDPRGGWSSKMSPPPLRDLSGDGR
jgi:hypothetical protein